MGAVETENSQFMRKEGDNEEINKDTKMVEDSQIGCTSEMSQTPQQKAQREGKWVDREDISQTSSSSENPIHKPQQRGSLETMTELKMMEDGNPKITKRKWRKKLNLPWSLWN